MAPKILLQYVILAATYLLLTLSPLAAASPNAGTASQFLLPHNQLRAALGLPPLQWSPALASYARWWARQRRGDCALVHSNTNYGENLFWGKGRGWQAGDAVRAWAAERSYYNYWWNSCQPNRDCLHYTQMVWRQSLRIGCAQVACASGDTFLTCNYDPHGNVIGQRPY